MTKTKITYTTRHEGQTKVRTSVNSIHNYTHAVWTRIAAGKLSCFDEVTGNYVSDPALRKPYGKPGPWICKTFSGSAALAEAQVRHWTKHGYEAVSKVIDEIVTKEIKEKPATIARREAWQAKYAPK